MINDAEIGAVEGNGLGETIGHGAPSANCLVQWNIGKRLLQRLPGGVDCDFGSLVLGELAGVAVIDSTDAP